MSMIRITKFEPGLAAALPETHALLESAGLTVHSSATRIVLHGSRGPARRYRPDSDVDLSLLVESPTPTDPAELEALLRAVYETTLHNWRGAIEADLAVVFETRNCALACFDQRSWEERICTIGGTDYFGLYKLQKGFNGLVSNAGIQVPRMYPCLTIWQRPHAH